MNALDRMRKAAQAESAAAKRLWAVGDSWDEDNHRPKKKVPPVIERIVPLIGTGMTQNEAAEYLGVTRGPIVKALTKLGAKL